MKDFFKTNSRDERGFVAIVALLILSVMTIYALMLHKTTVQTVENIKDTKRYYEARDIADGIMEYLKFEVKNHESGYNTGFVCGFGKFADEKSTGTGSMQDLYLEQKCNEFENIWDLSNKDVKIKFEIKGRSSEAEKFTGSCPGVDTDGCHVVPYPGTGSAGKNCDRYDPFEDRDNDGYPDIADLGAGTLIGHKGEVLEQGTAGDNGLPQIDYACNWDKLMFGSSSLDRASIPLYYQDENDEIINPYHEDALTQAQNFVLRVRTPCLPCVYGDKTATYGESRYCTRGDDPTICSEGDRYLLDVSDRETDDLVVQWQLTGKCDDDEGVEKDCGMVELVEFVEYVDGVIRYTFSGITEARINNGILSNGGYNEDLVHNNDINHSMLYKGELEGLNTITNKDELIFAGSSGFLTTLKRPLLSFLLSDKLISTTGRNIPYLEYQFLTDYPVSNSRIKMTVLVNVEGNIFEKTIYKDSEKPLVNFAVQN